MSSKRKESPTIAPLRSRIMRAITKKNTRPELAVRQVLHALGLRFRLHRSDLPGTPDIVLPRHKIAIQVHGCFWHQHPGCRYAKLPRSRPDYWLPKLARNIERDIKSKAALKAAGWHVLVIWECETKALESLRLRLSQVPIQARQARAKRP
jgi:DNA mismatch endonuclease, patch repair protein